MPTIKKPGPDKGWRVEYDGSGFQLSEYEHDPFFEVDEAAKQLRFQLHRDSYIPVAALKGLVKIGLTVLPDVEIPNFQATVDWIRDKDHFQPETRQRRLHQHESTDRNQDGIEPEALDEYARCLAAPGALRGGIAYFRAHKLDAEHNCENAKTKLPMPVMTVGGVASAGDALKAAVEPLAGQLRHVTIEECGHYIAEEQPAKLADELLRFFAD